MAVQRSQRHPSHRLILTPGTSHVLNQQRGGPMRDLQQALDSISVIRTQLARGTEFRGYGPRSIAVGGVLALAVALGQSWWFGGRTVDPDAFLIAWVVTAMVAATCSC